MATATRVRVGLFSPSIVLAVAEETGGLARRGVEVETVPVTSSPAQFRDLMSGELDLAITNPDNVMLYRFIAANPLGSRHDVRILLGVDRGLGLSVHLAPGLGSLDQLRGGRLGVDVDASGFSFAAYDLLARHGLRRDEDYTVVELGSTPRRLRVLLAGECEATMLGAGNDLLADDAGLTRAVRLTDEVSPYLATVVAAS
ncbi:MAG TPA: PhnD/SsuA/transferrin family substrate-binding protein, partial [Actinomycetes bacterium]|nr:PhnD/SsuA/transferrin family substrate-binding protein [Actinomycetes bacterium]